MYDNVHISGYYQWGEFWDMFYEAKRKARPLKPMTWLSRTHISSLAFADSEHLGATGRTNTLSSRFTILHGNGLGILHLFLGAALHTVCLHWVHLLFSR
jgi:hypothetical protein